MSSVISHDSLGVVGHDDDVYMVADIQSLVLNDLPASPPHLAACIVNASEYWRHFPLVQTYARFWRGNFKTVDFLIEAVGLAEYCIVVFEGQQSLFSFKNTFGREFLQALPMERVRGLMLVVPDETSSQTYWVEQVMSDPSVPRGRGVGIALMNGFLHAMCARGVVQALLKCTPSPAKAVGETKQHKLPDFYSQFWFSSEMNLMAGLVR